MDTRILIESDKAAISDFEKARLAQTVADPMDREMRAWNSRWRDEALAHYLPQGWSFGVFSIQKLTGYVLGQPYMFHRGLTQTLWIEHLSAVDQATLKHLVDVAHKWARDKHLQALLMEKNETTEFVLEEFPKATLWGELIELKSARF